jgi:hypothetical protein
MSTELKVEQIVKATPAQVYYASTHAISLTEWMCDFAAVAAHPGDEYIYGGMVLFILPENLYRLKKINPFSSIGISNRIRPPAR